MKLEEVRSINESGLVPKCIFWKNENLHVVAHTRKVGKTYVCLVYTNPSGVYAQWECKRELDMVKPYQAFDWIHKKLNFNF